MKALVLGKSSYSFVCNTNKMPVIGSTTNYNDVLDGPSGFAYYSSMLLSKFGIETYCASVIGDDSFGTNIKKALDQSGTHTEHMETAYGKKTNISTILFDKATNSTLTTNIEKEGLNLKKNDFSMNPDILLIDGFDITSALEAVNKLDDKITIINAIYAKQDLFELCKYCKYILVSQAFCEGVSGIPMNFQSSQTLLNNYKMLYGKFPNKTVVVNLAEKGIMYMKDNQIKIMPPLKLEILNKNKCYDIFAAGFAYAIACGYTDVEKAVTFASIASSIAMSQKEVDSVPSISEIMTHFGEKYPDTVTSVKKEEVPTTMQPKENSSGEQQISTTNQQTTTEASESL